MPRMYTRRRVPRVCARCGVAFEIIPSVITQGGGKYCGLACRDAAVTRRIDRACVICGITISVVPAKAMTAKYCSRICQIVGITRHGETSRTRRRSPEYNAWENMKKRCLNPRFSRYPDYGGRGITVCDRWRDSYEAFLADIGRRPSTDHSVDRIDNDGNYEPGNVKWSTRREQEANKRRKWKHV